MQRAKISLIIMMFERICKGKEWNANNIEEMLPF